MKRRVPNVDLTFIRSSQFALQLVAVTVVAYLMADVKAVADERRNSLEPEIVSMSPALLSLNAPQTEDSKTVPKRVLPTLSTKPLKLPPAQTTSTQSNEPSQQPANCTPDLRISRVELDPRYPRAEQEYRIKVWVLQFLPSGVTQAPLSFIAIRRAGHSTAIDSQYVRFANNNSLVTPDFEWKHREWNSESLEVYIKLDHQNQLNECREDNNEFVQRYTVYGKNQPMADLAFNGYINYDTKNLVNRDVKIWGEIKNKGNDEARPFWIEFVCDDDRDARTKLTHRVHVTQIIKGGALYTFKTGIRWNKPGMKVCQVTLDKEDEVIESSENNNEYTGVTVHIDRPPPVQ